MIPTAEEERGGALHPRFEKYLDAWVAKVLSVEKQFHPLDAPGGMHGSVRLGVSINPDGSVEEIKVVQSSGYEELDRAAIRIVELASPFAPFPPEIRRDTDSLVITRTWTFFPGGWIQSR